MKKESESKGQTSSLVADQDLNDGNGATMVADNWMNSI